MQHAAAWLEPQPLDKSFMVLEGMVPGIADAVVGTGADHHLGWLKIFAKAGRVIEDVL